MSRYHIVLNEQQLPEPYETAKEAAEEAERMARAYESEHGHPVSWFISAEPKGH